MNSLWFEDIMNQSFHEDISYNPTKLLIVYYLVKDGSIHEKYSMLSVMEYVYQTYIDNVAVAQKHSSYLIRNIKRYGVSDIKDTVLDALLSWTKDAKNNILNYNEKYIWIDLKTPDNELAADTKKLCKMLYKKYYREIIPEPSDVLSEIHNLDDHDLLRFGQGLYRNRVLEDMQYCPLCESIELDNLYCVHILENSMGASEEDMCNKNNGLLFCKKHAESYLARRFYFDDLGFVHEVEKCDIEKGMHLSFNIRNAERKKYLQKRVEALDC